MTAKYQWALCQPYKHNSSQRQKLPSAAGTPVATDYSTAINHKNNSPLIRNTLSDLYNKKPTNKCYEQK